MKATVVVVTKNRRDHLRTALRSSLNQTVPVEVIVVDDASTDDTANMVRVEFPRAKFVRHEHSIGPSSSRNEAANAATSDVIFSIDDDAEFVSPNTVEQTLDDFEDARVGAVAIPYVEPKKGTTLLQAAPDRSGIWITDCFIGTAYAIRRDVFLKVGGYRDRLFIQGEERDFCFRMLQLGYVVRLGRADAIHHYESPIRDIGRVDYLGRRNDVLFAWHYAPASMLPVHILGTIVNGFGSAWRSGRYQQMLRGTAAGLAECVTRPDERMPASSTLYRLHRKLKTSGPQKFEDVLSELR